MRRVTTAAIDHTTTGRRPRRRGGAAVLVVVALVAAALAAVVTPAGPVAADGNEAPGAPLAARSITAGGGHTCAILPFGVVKCWGENFWGQLGYDSTAHLGDAPGEIRALPAVNLGVGRTATAITAGINHTCALLDDATVKCWGLNSQGQLGQDSTTTLGDNPGEMAALAPVNLGAGRTATAVTAGQVHTCALLDDATVKCWGNGNAGQLGQDSTTTLGDNPGEMAALAPVNLGAGRTATAITAGSSHTCALLDDATVKCWGNGGVGRLGQDSTTTLGDNPGEMAALAPVNLGAGRTATAVTAGNAHTCALLDDATVKCWGAGDNGMLGQDSTAYLGDNPGEMAALAPVNLGAGRTATAVTAGSFHTCALLDDATVKCWGFGAHGQLGQGSTADLGDNPGEMAALAPINLGAGRTATAVTTGENHTCALLDDATVKCWGRGASGQLGQDSTANLGDSPGEMAALGPVDLGVPLRVVLTADELYVEPGEVIHYHLTITNNSTSPLTGITVTDPNAPACVQAVPNLAGGQTHTVNCSYTTSGADFPTRANTATVDTDQTGPTASNQVNTAVSFASTATAVTAGGNHSCALLDNGTVKCWGLGNRGQLRQDSTTTLGDNPGEMAALAPVNLGVGRTATAITAGGTHTCALLDDATVKCWGLGASGQLGQDSTANLGDQAGEMAALAPVNLGAGRTATAITAGGNHSCALLDDATVKCWGLGASGQLGQDSSATLGDQAGEMAALAPVNLGAGRTATAITAGASHTCARLDDATVKCWGRGAEGQLGQDSTTGLGDNAGEMAAMLPVNLGFGSPGPASMSVVLTADETSVAAGATIHYHLTVTNTGVPALSGFTVSDPNAPNCVQAIAGLAAGANQTIDCIYTTTAADVGTYANTATVDTDQTAPVVSNTVNVSVTTASAPSMTVVKSADETTVVLGATIHLHVTVANTGNVALNDVTVDDPNGPDCEVAQFDLAVGADRTVDCTYTATLGELAGGYSNTASVTADEVTTAVVSNTVDVTVTIPPGFGLVSGTETGTGTPIAGAVVAVLSTATYAPVAVATANAAGEYVAAPPAGTYFVYVLDPTGGHAAGFSGAPTAVIVPDGATTIADAALASTRGTLAGTVSDTGGPVAGVLAMSIDLANGQPGAGDLTDTNGTYTIPGLAPGPRLLEFVDLSGAHTVEFHDNSPTPAGASVPIIVGATTTTADAELAAATPPGTTAHLTGTITTTTGGGNLEGIAVFAARTSDFGLAAGDLTDASGNYDIALDPGTYKLAFYDPSGTHLFEWHDNQPASGLGSAATVTATAGTPLATNAALTPTTGVVSGTVTESGSNANLANVFVAAITTNGVVVGGTTTAANGTYTLTDLPVGNIRIRFVDLGAAHTDEYHDNAPDYGTATLIPITAGGATTGINAALTAIE